jgi:hypothetical protein
VTPDEADATRIRLTATQSQRLRELGADPIVLDELFADPVARDAAPAGAPRSSSSSRPTSVRRSPPPGSYASSPR